MAPKQKRKKSEKGRVEGGEGRRKKNGKEGNLGSGGGGKIWISILIYIIHPCREDLRLILMSATININLFNDYFDGEAPVIQVDESYIE